MLSLPLCLSVSLCVCLSLCVVLLQRRFLLSGLSWVTLARALLPFPPPPPPSTLGCSQFLKNSFGFCSYHFFFPTLAPSFFPPPSPPPSMQFLTPSQEDLQRGLSPLPPGTATLEGYQASLEEVPGCGCVDG